MTNYTSEPEWFREHLEWERYKDPARVLDEWREAETLLGALSNLAHDSHNEALTVALCDVRNRVALRVAHWEEDVRMRLA